MKRFILIYLIVCAGAAATLLLLWLLECATKGTYVAPVWAVRSWLNTCAIMLPLVALSTWLDYHK